MQKRNQVLGMAVYHIKPGKEKEFMKSWQEGPARICETMGGKALSLYYKSNSNDYVATAHLPTLKMAEQFANSKEVREWNQAVASMFRESPTTEVYEIFQERAV